MLFQMSQYALCGNPPRDARYAAAGVASSTAKIKARNGRPWPAEPGRRAMLASAWSSEIDMCHTAIGNVEARLAFSRCFHETPYFAMKPVVIIRNLLDYRRHRAVLQFLRPTFPRVDSYGRKIKIG